MLTDMKHDEAIPTMRTRPFPKAAVKFWFTTEMAASFAVSLTSGGDLVAHVHWQDQRPVSSWHDILTLHRQTGLVPCCFGGAFDALARKDGCPPDSMTAEIFRVDEGGPARPVTS